jgi:AAA domain
VGLTTREMLAIFEANLAELRESGKYGTYRDPTLPEPVDWDKLFGRDSQAEWLVENVWPCGRQVHLHAARKTGKSLISLWIACKLATGHDPFTDAEIQPVVVGYLDYEMTEDDLLERVEEMGFSADDLRGTLWYYLHPALPALDTELGGKRLMDLVSADGVEAVIIDTMSRVVVGDENSNDTYIRFYKNTGNLLKAAGVAMLRLDHEGHESGRSRGASAKADDVDLIWQLRELEGDCYEFVRKAARIAWAPELVKIRKLDEPSLRFTRAEVEVWPLGTLEKAQQLDICDAPLNVSKRKAVMLLKEYGFTAGKATTLLAAIKYRNFRILGV